MAAAGLPVPESVVVTSLDQLDGCPVPAVVRPAFTLGGRGGGLARTRDELRATVSRGIAASPIGQVLVERSLEGWQEFELEVIVDTAGNCIVVCSIENLDPDRRPHRRLLDGRAAADAPGRRVAAAARRRLHLRPRRRRGDRRRQRPVRLRAADARAAADRDEPARLALLRARLEGDRLPDREARRAARGRLHARRAAERHHRRLERRVRAGARLRRRQGAALRLREVPGQLERARNGDAGRRRGARARPHVPRGLPEGARGRRGGRRRSRRSPACTRTSRTSSSRSARPSSELAASGDVAGGEAVRASRRADRAAARDRRGGGARPPRPPRPARRRLVRGEFEARTPYYYLSLRAGRRGRDSPPAPIVVLGSGPNRIGQGIEFDYCCVRAAQAFRRLGYEAVLAQLEPRDGLDRLRHLATASTSSRSRSSACSTSARSSSRSASSSRWAGRRRSRSRTASPRRACRCSATRSARSTPPRTAATSAPCSTSSA